MLIDPRSRPVDLVILRGRGLAHLQAGKAEGCPGHKHAQTTPRNVNKGVPKGDGSERFVGLHIDLQTVNSSQDILEGCSTPHGRYQANN